MAKLIEMQMDDRVKALARKALAREQAQARYKAWKLEQKLQEAKQAETILASTATYLGVETGPCYDEAQVERAKAQLVRAFAKYQKADIDASRRSDQLRELKARFQTWYPHEPLPPEVGY